MSKLDIIYELFGEDIYIKTKLLLKRIKTDSKILKLINKNLKFKNCHEGERCFILGNGPSLREVDLSSLSDEVVFSVNNFSRVKNFKEAKINYHLWADEAFFEMREDNKMDHEELMYNYKAIAEEAPCCFVPLVGKRYIEDNKLDKILDINYFDIFEWVKEGRRIICDLDKQITGFTTVVQYAIVIAIYMGFKEIYLLGCDSTNIIAMLNIIMNVENKDIHAYDVDDAKERYHELLKKWTMTDLFGDQYTFFLGYKMLNEECNRRRIVLKNLSEVTLINEIVRDRLSDIL